jgi:hypothetical protein
MRYHADLQWVRMAFRNFSRTVVVFYQHLYQAPQAPKGASGGYFDLGVLLKGRLERYRVEQGHVIGEMVAAVNARAARGRNNE